MCANHLPVPAAHAACGALSIFPIGDFLPEHHDIRSGVIHQAKKEMGYLMEMLGNILGLMGMMCFLVAYFMLQRNVWMAQSYKYFGANLAGSILLIISLLIDWNLPAFMLEAAWGLISIWGLIKLTQTRKNDTHP